MASGGGGVKDFVTIVLKGMTKGGGGVKNCLKLRDVIYGRPLTYHTKLLLHEIKNYRLNIEILQHTNV